jgi:hypothetical protein
MKALFITFHLLVTFSSFSQNNTEAIKFNDDLVNFQNQIGEQIVYFNSVVGLENASFETVNPVLNELVKTVNEVILKAEKLKPYDNNIELKNAFMDLFKFYQRTVNTEYKEIVKIIFVDEKMDVDRVNLLIDKVTQEEAVLDAKFKSVQNAYALKYKFKLVENEIQEKIDE